MKKSQDKSMSSNSTLEALKEEIQLLNTPELMELIIIISDEVQIRLMQEAK